MRTDQYQHRVRWVDSHVTDASAAIAEKSKREIVESKELLEKTLGRAVTLFAYPYGETNDSVDRYAKDAGFEAAFATDLRIASWDENARGHFGRLAANFAPLQKIIWVNPVIEGERAVQWLEAGAKAQRWRRLKPSG